MYIKKRVKPWIPFWFWINMNSYFYLHRKSDLAKSADFKTKMEVMVLLYSLCTQVWPWNISSLVISCYLTFTLGFNKNYFYFSGARKSRIFDRDLKILFFKAHFGHNIRSYSNVSNNRVLHAHVILKKFHSTRAY